MDKTRSLGTALQTIKGDGRMAGFLPTAALTAVQYGMDKAQQKSTDAAQLNQHAAQIQAQTAQLHLSQEQEDRSRRDRLRRALASQRARFGAQGIGESASGNAVMAGLAADSDEEAADSAAVTSLRVSRLNDEYAQRRNLLEAAQPRNRLAFSLLQRGLRTVPLIDE